MARPAARKGDLAKHEKAPPGPILRGSGNVLINSLPAARMGDKVQHKKGEEPIVQGSGSVLFNGKNAARITDKVACGGEVIAGSGNVLIGDGAGGRACSQCPGGVTVGSPVNPLLGAKVLFGPEDMDFALPGPLPLVWQRHYSSYVGPAGAAPGLLGSGWRLPFELHLVLGADQTTLFDTKNRTITFEPLGSGEQRHAASEGFWLLRGGQTPVAADPMAQAAAAWQEDPRWDHVPLSWKSDPHYVMAATAERTVWLFAALDKTPDDDTLWVPVAMVDVFGRTQRYERNLSQRQDLPRGQLLSIEDGLGRHYVLGYTWTSWHKAPEDLRLDHVTLDGMEMPLVRYRYAAGDLSEVIDRHGRTVREFHYEHHRISAHRVLGGPWARYTYASDAPGAKVTQHSVEEGQAYRFDYHSDQTVVTDSLGRRTVYGFTGEGGRQRLSSITDPLGGVTQYHYNLEGQLVQEVDALGRRSTTLRDEQGRIISTQGPDGRKTASTWDSASGQLTSITGPDGGTTGFAHDRYGRMVKVTNALGHSTEYRYADPKDDKERPTAEHPRQIIDAKGGIKTLAWTRTGQLARYTDCSGHSTQYRYDGWGALVEVTNALGQTLRHERNEQGLVRSTVYPDGSRTQYHYDARGQLSTVTDALGGQTLYQRDRHGRVLKSLASAPSNGQERPAPQTLAYRYDAAGQLSELVNENGAVTTFAYDALDRLVQETGFDGRTQRYEYDAASQLLSARDSANAQEDAPTHTTRYAYDKGGRLIERHATAGSGAWTAGESEVHRFEYDRAGRLIAASTQGAQVHFKHDVLGRIEEEGLRCLGSSTNAVFEHTLTHRYDPLGKRICSQQPYVGEIDYLSYGSDHVHQIALNKTALVDFERDALHRETQRTLFSGVLPAQGIQVHRRFDAMGRMVNSWVGGGVDGGVNNEVHAGIHTPNPEPTVGGLSRAYTFDGIGQLTAIQKPSLLTTHYGYDHSHRLIYAQDRQHFAPPSDQHSGLKQQPSAPVGSPQHWRFDAAGNRIAHRDRHRVSNNRIPQDDEGSSLQYDAWGNLARISRVDGATVMFRYDGLHQLRASQTYNPRAESQDQLTTVYYDYDAFGRRYNKRRVRERQKQDLNQQGPDKTLLTLYITWFGWDGDRLITTQTQDQISTTVYEPSSFVPLIRIDTRKVDQHNEDGIQEARAQKSMAFFHCNHLGTPLALIDAGTSKIIWQAELDPWGNTATEYNPYRIDQPIRMQGQQKDSETSLFYNRHRYYQPKMGRYTTQDPIGLRGGSNKYSYTGGAPTSFIDPLGLWASQMGFYVHQQVGQYVFGRELTLNQNIMVMKGHEWADSMQNQTSDKSFMHAMRDGDKGQTAANACAQANAFIKKIGQMAIDEKNNGNPDKAAFLFGVALHTIQDSTSPAHAGFKAWSNNESTLSQILHGLSETGDPGKYSPLWKETKKAWDAYNKGDANGFAIKCPCAF
jgi:RHS repeat-associated protein